MNTTASSTPRVSGRSAARRLGGPVPQHGTIAVLVIVAIALPWVLDSSFWMGTLTLTLIWGVLNQSWNLVLGSSGIWHFGQLAVYAIGGYAAAILSLRSGLPAVLALAVGGLLAAAVSLVLSVPTLRLRGIYVSLLTFGFAEVIRLLVIADQSGFTGGSFGLSGFDGFGLDDWDPVSRRRAYYWIALGVLALASVVMFWISRSPLGTALTALRDSPALAAARGISPRRYQSTAFAISGFFAGVAGGLYAFTYGVISPSVMGLGPLTLLVTMLVVGGLGTQTGPLVGTLVISVVSARLEQYPEVRLILLGLVLLLMVLLMPRGIVPRVASIRRRIQDWVDEEEEVDDEEDLAVADDSVPTR